MAPSAPTLTAEGGGGPSTAPVTLNFSACYQYYRQQYFQSLFIDIQNGWTGRSIMNRIEIVEKSFLEESGGVHGGKKIQQACEWGKKQQNKQKK